eukprot:6442916-Amphidinium_carterae.1
MLGGSMIGSHVGHRSAWQRAHRDHGHDHASILQAAHSRNVLLCGPIKQCELVCTLQPKIGEMPVASLNVSLWQ